MNTHFYICYDYCCEFLLRYGRIETIQNEWTIILEDIRQVYPEYLSNNDIENLFDYLDEFLSRYGRIESIRYDWNVYRNNFTVMQVRDFVN